MSASNVRNLSPAEQLNESLHSYAGSVLSRYGQLRGSLILKSKHLAIVHEYCGGIIGRLDDGCVGWESPSIDVPTVPFIKFLSNGLLIKYSILTHQNGYTQVTKQLSPGRGVNYVAVDNGEAIEGYALSPPQLVEFLHSQEDFETATDAEVHALNAGFGVLV